MQDTQIFNEQISLSNVTHGNSSARNASDFRPGSCS